MAFAFSNQIVLLVGGRGTRLGSLASDTPKPLMQIDSQKVFLDYLIENCARQGFDDIVLLAGHLGDQIKARYHNRKVANSRVSVVIEPTPMGTAGALRFALDRLAPMFLVANGDTLFDINMRVLDAILRANPRFQAVLALRDHDDAGRFGSVSLAPDGLIVEFAEKRPESTGLPGLINGGIYVLQRALIEELADGPSSIETDLFPRLATAQALGGVRCSGYFLDIGLPETLAQARDELPRRMRPVLFLDRDGVVNIDKNYVHRVEDFEWVEGVVELIRRRNDLGHAVIVITNQAGVARGYYQEADVIRLHGHIQDSLRELGGFIDDFYYCPHHELAVVDRYKIAHHPDRKPLPGMLEKAFHDHPLDRSQALFIGDQKTDMEAATAAGIHGALYGEGSVAEFEAEFLRGI